jgi:hypothetical protein
MPLKLRPTGLGAGIDKDRTTPTDDLGGRQGAVSEELGRVEGKGEAGGVAVGSDQQRSHALRTTVRRLPLVS